MNKTAQKNIITLVSFIIILLGALGVIDLTGNTPPSEGMYKVVKVIDGDTIEVKGEHDPFTVRLIGINTPETVDPRRPVECFGKEASAYMKSLVEHKEVILEYDYTQNEKDKYGRTLAYVILDGTNVNKQLIEEGYAYEYTYERPYLYQTQFKEAQKKAEQEKRGLWADGVCD